MADTLIGIGELMSPPQISIARSKAACASGGKPVRVGWKMAVAAAVPEVADEVVVSNGGTNVYALV
ncbi:MAG: hypothetical protein ABR540_02850 [Acidimicrobiales bacterium]